MKRAYIANFPGVGNGVMLMPILKHLVQNKVYDQIFCTENGIIRNKDLVDIAGIGGHITPIPSAWRRFQKDHWKEIYTFLKTNAIDTVYNLRNVNLEDYESFKREYPDLHYFDLKFEQLISRANQAPIFSDIFNLFADTLYINGKKNCEWISQYRKTAISTDIGLMISASQSNKILHLAKWIELGNKILKEDGSYNIKIFSGIEPEDISSAKKVIHSINNRRCEYVGNKDLSLSAKAIGRLKCFISTDTGLLHLAAAVGVPTIGIYISTDPKIWRPNAFPATAACKSSNITKCGLWKKYAGTCGHFYETCPYASSEDISTQLVFEEVMHIVKST